MQLKPLAAALLLTSVMTAAIAAPSPMMAPKGKADAAAPAQPAPSSKEDAVQPGLVPQNVAPATGAILAPTPTQAVPTLGSTSGAAAAPAGQLVPVLEEGAVNPFTGEALSAERRKREAERIRAENQVLEERIKQVNLLNDLNHAPVRKRVEMEIYLDNTRPKTTPAGGPTTVTPPKTAAAPVAGPDTSSKDKRTKKVAVSKGSASPSTSKPALATTNDQLVKPKVVQSLPEVVGVIRTKEGSTAVLNNNGRTILARPGEQSSVGVVTAVSDRQVQLGNQTLDYNQPMVARIQRTDKDPQAAAAAPAAAPSTRSLITLPPIPGTGNTPTLPPSVRPSQGAGQATSPAAP